MQRRHFELIAAIIAELEPETRRKVAPQFADRLCLTNVHFNRARFLAACNV